MTFIKRDESNKICSVSLTPQDSHTKCTPEDIDELDDYLQQLEMSGQQIAGTDLPMVRVLEDLIDLLIEREIICFTDLPQFAQDKLITRRRLRAAMSSGLDLLDDEVDPIL